jgi:HEAT repeat protein
MATKKRKAAKSAKPAKPAKAPARRSASAAAAAAASGRRSVDERVAALAEARLVTSEKEDSLQAVLKILRDKEEPAQVRLAALRSIQAAGFGSPVFESVRGDYIATLREVAQDPDRELRRRALGALAREKDGFAQKKLLEGLQDPEKALVPPEKALQLLSYDVHAEAYPIAREMVSKPPNTAAKREALRLLAADATAAPVFEKILRDKEELPEIRRVSASALHALKPEKLQEYAREMLLDASEKEEMQALSLTALTQFGDEEAVAKDEALLKRVDRLSAEAPKKVRDSARQFLSRYGR